MTAQQERKQVVRAFMRAHYTDERLAQLLAHAQDGKLAFASCCCFIGCATADHPLRGSVPFEAICMEPHFDAARILDQADAESAFAYLYWNGNESENNKGRSRVLIPIIRAEMKRRAAIRGQMEEELAPPSVPIYEEPEEVVAERIADKIIAEALESGGSRFTVELTPLDVAELEVK